MSTPDAGGATQRHKSPKLMPRSIYDVVLQSDHFVASSVDSFYLLRRDSAVTSSSSLTCVSVC